MTTWWQIQCVLTVTERDMPTSGESSFGMPQRMPRAKRVRGKQDEVLMATPFPE
jgi:hypothetical protein